MKLRSEQGTAVVEFAVVLPLLLIIVFGIVEFSFMLHNRGMITNAAREGARAGIVIGEGGSRLSKSDIQSIVNSYLTNNLVSFTSGSPATPTVDVAVNGDKTKDPADGMVSLTDYLTVEVSYEYEFLLLPKFVAGIASTDGTKNLFASSTMRAD